MTVEFSKVAVHQNFQTKKYLEGHTGCWLGSSIFTYSRSMSRRSSRRTEPPEDAFRKSVLSSLQETDGDGDIDVQKNAKDITEANKLTKKVRPQHSGNSRGHDKYGGRPAYGSQRRFQPYPRGKTSDFLGKSRFSKPPRKKKDGETSQRP